MTDPVLSSIDERLDARLSRLAAEHGFPGLVAGIVRGDELAWIRGYGAVDFDSGTTPDENTVFRCASITKTFTGTAIFQLRDAGKLGLDDPLSDHVPEFLAASGDAGPVEAVTIRRLLAHYSGLVSEAPLPYWETYEFPEMSEVLASLPGVRVAIPQDSAWKYCNLGFALLGEVVERASGTPYRQYVRENILEPLGMTSTGFKPESPDTSAQARMATGYTPAPFQDRPEKAPHPPLNGIDAAGGIYSCAADLAKWVSLQFRADAEAADAAPVLPGASLAEMQRIHYMEPDWSAGQALPWRCHRRGENLYMGHGGSLPGYRTGIYFNQAHRTGVIVLTNLGAHDAIQPIAFEVLDTVIAAQHAAPDPAVVAPPAALPDGLAPCLGLYRGFSEVVVEYREGALRLAPPGGMTGALHTPAVLEPTDDANVFMVRGGRGSGEPAVFERGEDGEVTGFTLGGFRYRKAGPSVPT